MSKYQVTIHFPDGDEELEDLFDTEEEAREAALDAISSWDTGSEILHMSNPGDYDYDEDAVDDVLAIIRASKLKTEKSTQKICEVMDYAES